MYVDDIKLTGKTENMEPTWKILMKDVDLGEPTSFLDMYIWDALKEGVKSAKILWLTTEIGSNPGFLLGPKKNYRPELQGNLIQKSYLPGPTPWKVMQRNVRKGIANLQVKRLNNFSKSRRYAWTTINLKKKKMSR